MSILLGIVVIAAGAVMVFKTEALYQNFGSIPIFDRYLHTEGGSRLGYKLIGIMMIFIGTLILTDLMDAFLGWLLAPLIDWAKPPSRG